MSTAPGPGAGTLPEPAELCAGVRVMFTGRGGGTSTGPFAALNLGSSVGDDPAAVAANRKIVAAACGPAGLAWMRQVHGAEVRYAAGPADPGADPPEADAIFTGVPGLTLGVLVADCAPVLLADPHAGLAGAAHAGRQGLARGVVPALVGAMAAAGAEPARMHAVIGPVICGRCYAVPAALREQVAALVPGAGCVTAAGTAGIDIRAGLEGQLARAGVTRVSGDRRCPAQDSGLFSYRRDGRTGRFAGLIWLAP